MEIQENVPLFPLTTFQIGGHAKYFIEVTNVDDLGAALDYAETRNVPFFILAGGSNVLISDDGFDGLVIKIAFAKNNIDTVTKKVFAEAGCNLMEIIREAASLGLSGMEGLYGIPGSVGGAVRGNAGAFGTEMLDVVEEVTAVHRETREMKVFSNADCNFSYRSSYFKKNPEWVVLSATFALTQESSESALQAAEATLKLREERQIQNIKAAGSFFMNPKTQVHVQEKFMEEKGVAARGGRVPAGWLIEKAGFKGLCKDGACTGERSANYVINNGTATAASVIRLTDEIREAVLNTLEVELEREVTTVGF